MYSTVVEYSLKFRNEGLLLGTRSCNLLITAYVGLRDFDSAYDVLNILESEEEYVRYRGCQTFSELPKADSFAKHAQEMLIVKEAKIIEQEKMAIGGGGKDDGEGEYYDKDGKYLEDIFAHRRKKYSVITVGVTSPKVAFANSDDDNNDSDNGSSNDKSSRLNKSISERFAEERKKKRLEKKTELSPLTIGYNEFIKNNRSPIPHFGVNVHTFTALICNPYLNINSRNYYSPTKNVSERTYLLGFTTISHFHHFPTYFHEHIVCVNFFLNSYPIFTIFIFRNDYQMGNSKGSILLRKK